MKHDHGAADAVKRFQTGGRRVATAGDGWAGPPKASHAPATRVLRGEPLVPLSDVTFAERPAGLQRTATAGGRPGVGRAYTDPAGFGPRSSPSTDRGQLKPGWPYRLPFDPTSVAVGALTVSPDGRLFMRGGDSQDYFLLAPDPDGRLSD